MRKGDKYNRVTIAIDAEVHSLLKVMSAQTGLTMSKLIKKLIKKEPLKLAPLLHE